MKVIGTKYFIIHSFKNILYLTFSILYVSGIFLSFIIPIIEILLWALSIANPMQTIIMNIIAYAYLIMIFILFLYLLSNIPSTFQYFKIYNKISISKWREKLLAFGFVEILEGNSLIPNLDDKQFIITGKNYENLPIKIQSSGQNAEIIEINIPLVLEKDKNFELLQSNFKINYPSQNCILSQEKLYKTISITEAVEDKIIWETINQLIAIVKEQKYTAFIFIK